MRMIESKSTGSAKPVSKILPNITNKTCIQQQLNDQLNRFSNDGYDRLIEGHYFANSSNRLLNDHKKNYRKKSPWQQQLSQWITPQAQNIVKDKQKMSNARARWKKSFYSPRNDYNALNQEDATINEAELNHRYTFLNQHFQRKQSSETQRKPYQPTENPKSPKKIILSLSLPKKVPQMFRESFFSCNKLLNNSSENSESKLSRNLEKIKKINLTPYSYTRHNDGMKNKMLANLQSVLEIDQKRTQNWSPNSSIQLKQPTTNKRKGVKGYVVGLNRRRKGDKRLKAVLNVKERQEEKKSSMMHQYPANLQTKKADKQKIKQLKKCIMMNKSEAYS